MATATVLVKDRVLTNIGSISAINSALTFGIPDMTQPGRGNLWIQASSAGSAAVSTPTWVLEASLDQGVSWFVVAATTSTLTGLMTGDTAAIFAASYNVSGLGGCLFHFGLTAGTGITALTIWAGIS